MNIRQSQHALVRAILQHPGAFHWEVQGFGFLRTYLHHGDKTWRLHIWDSALRTPGVSSIHNHPWDFQSFVVSGMIRNLRYREIPDHMQPVANHCGPFRMNRQRMQPGSDAYLIDEPVEVKLAIDQVEEVRAGAWYHQYWHEVHDTEYDDGTITLIQRVFSDRADEALVYYPVGSEWGNAKPRPATEDEVQFTIERALDKLS